MADTPNKLKYGGKSIYQQGDGQQIFYFGKVVNNDDNFDGNRVKVRIKGIDDAVLDGDLKFCFPMIPRHLNIVPNIGETVVIIVPHTSNPFENRMYFGPIISLTPLNSFISLNTRNR